VAYWRANSKPSPRLVPVISTFCDIDMLLQYQRVLKL
jgi:hypothetical protein